MSLRSPGWSNDQTTARHANVGELLRPSLAPADRWIFRREHAGVELSHVATTLPGLRSSADAAGALSGPTQPLPTMSSARTFIVLLAGVLCLAADVSASARLLEAAPKLSRGGRLLASSLSCEVDGVAIRHRSAKYLFGRPHRAGSVYATCADRQLRCYEDTGIADAPALKSKEIDCSLESLRERKARRSLGIAVNLVEDVWPNGTLWYRVDNDSFTDDQLAVINAAIEFYGQVDVNITLKECEPESLCGGKYLSIEQDEDACYGFVGYVNDGEPQAMNLGETCLEEGGVGSVVHELGHAMGLYHEHTHPNREVIVLTDQNLPVSADNYAKETDALLTAYDPTSIMHYGRSAGLCFPKSYYPLKAFCDVEQTVNCIMPVEQHCNSTRDSEIGQMAVLSAGDIYALRALYGSRDGLNSTATDMPVPTVSALSSSSSQATDDGSSTAGEADGESFTFSATDEEESGSSDSSGSSASVDDSGYQPGDVHSDE